MKRLLVTSIALIGLASSTTASAKLKIGVVNLQRAVSETNEGKREERRLNAEKKRLERQLNSKLKKFYKEEKELRKAWSILKDSEKKKRATAAQKRMESLKQDYVKAERSLAKKQSDAMMKITRKINGIIKSLAKRGGYDYIFANAAVLWAPNHVDVTNEVIRLYNGK